jgi:hypothetical protein
LCHGIGAKTRKKGYFIALPKLVWKKNLQSFTNSLKDYCAWVIHANQGNLTKGRTAHKAYKRDWLYALYDKTRVMISLGGSTDLPKHHKVSGNRLF